MMNYLKRRFSQGDMQEEMAEEERRADINAINSTRRLPAAESRPTTASSNTNATSSSSSSSGITASSTQTRSSSAVPQTDRRPAPSPSAPSSPTKILSFSAMMNAARDILVNTTPTPNGPPETAAQSQQGSLVGRFLPRQQTMTKDKSKVLLVIDNSNVDWSRYFKSKKLLNEFEIRVEQAEFKEINLASYSSNGTIVDLNVNRNGTSVVR